MTVREDYGIPAKDAAPVPLRMFGLVGLLLALSLIGWLVSGGGSLFVIALGVCVLALVFLGVAHVLGSRKLSQPPPSDPR